MERIIIGNKLGNARIYVGKDIETKVNLIVGVNSKKEESIELEKSKIDAAAKLGIHTIIDLSTVRLDQPLWQYGKEKYPNIAFGRVAPILVSVENNGEVSPAKLLKEYEYSVLSGIDYMTLNLIPENLQDLENINRRSNLTTSRQGGVLLNYMIRNKKDNPHNNIMNEIYAMFREYNVTMHIGSTFRPNSVVEAYDKAHLWELKKQMELFKKTDEAKVQAIVEPMSHQPLSDIGGGIEKLRSEFGSYIPFQMLGPIVTEMNFNSDQYSAGPGAAIAAIHNVGKVTTIPPREHVGFPSLEDTIEGIKATLTAVHAGDMCRIPYLLEEDRKIAYERINRKSCNPDSKSVGCNKCLELCPLLIENNYTK